jgi:hypothetical protein
VNENSVEDQEPVRRVTSVATAKSVRALMHTRENPRRSSLFTPVVGVSAGVCVAPDFGMTGSFRVVDGIEVYDFGQAGRGLLAKFSQVFACGQY